MKPQLVEDNDTHYVMHDGKSRFRVPKAGLSDEMHGKIRALAPKKMAEGGAVPGPFESPEEFAARTAPAGLPWVAPGVEMGGQRLENGQPVVASTAPPVAPVEAAPSPLEKQDWYSKPDAAPSPMAPVAQPKAVETAPQSWEAQQAAKIGFADDETPKPTPKKSGGAPAVPARPMADAFAEEKKALEAETGAKMAQNDATAAVQADLAAKLQANAIDQNEVRARAAQHAEASMAEVQRARDGIKKLDMTVDPGRFWASRSTPGKIAGVIGLVLGALGAGPDGVNRATGIIQQSIDRDLDAQKTEHTLRMQQGQSALDSATQLYSLHRQMGLDDIAANAAAKGTALDLAKAQVGLAEAQTANPIAKAALQKLHAQLDQQQQAADAATKQRQFDNGIKQQDANTRAREAGLREGKAGGSYLGGNAAFNELKAEWQGAGGKSGLITSHIPGTKANDFNDTLDARATAIATQLNGGKMPKPASIEFVKKTMPRPGDSVDDGNNKLRALAQLLSRGTLPAEAEERE